MIGLIFDLDGTLVDTVYAHIFAWQRAFNELDPKKRAALFQRVDALLAKDLPSIPLYSRPDPLIWRSGIAGMKNNPSRTGFAWNMEQWRWKP